MTAKRFLEQAYWLDKRIERRAEEAARMRARLEKSNSHISDMPRGGNGQDWTDADIKVMELEQRIRQEIARLCELKRQIGDAIDAVEDGRYRTLLELRYRNFETWEQIAIDMNYSYMHVYRLHSKALNAVKVPKEANNGNENKGDRDGIQRVQVQKQA